MKKIERAQATLTEFGAGMEPMLYVDPGESFMVETEDNFHGKIKTNEDIPSPKYLPFLLRQFQAVNPLAGPIYVNGLKAGDLMVVEIEDIIPEKQGWSGFGELGGGFFNFYKYPELQNAYARIIRHEVGPSGTYADGTGHFNVNRDVTIPLHPFIGTMVTAPERQTENSVTTQGPWGGNIDCKHVCVGNKIMLNTYHDGGLLFFGDVHGAQSDAELTGFADEAAATTIAKCHIIPQKRIPGVMRIETPTSLIQIDSVRNSGNPTEALRNAFDGMMQWLTQDYGLDSREVYIHFSANPDVIIHTYQFTGSRSHVMGVEFPKKYL